MANINVKTIPSNTSITVKDGNNISAVIAGGNNISLQVTPTPTQVIQINRGVAGRDGGDFIGGYPVLITSAKNYDALMFINNEWTNIDQLEIADGGNF